MNLKTKRKYRTLDKIVARLNDGATEQECKTVIDNKWGDDFFRKDNNRLMRPLTLFSKTHFDDYLNDIPQATIDQEEIEKWVESEEPEGHGT